MAKGALIRGTRELAALVGASHVAVSKWIRRDDWPFGAGPWKETQIAQVLQWKASTLSPANLPSVETAGNVDVRSLHPLKKADLKLKIERGKILERVNKLGDQEYHSVADCDARRLAQIEAAKNELLAVADGLPFETDVKSLVRNRILGALTRLSE